MERHRRKISCLFPCLCCRTCQVIFPIRLQSQGYLTLSNTFFKLLTAKQKLRLSFLQLFSPLFATNITLFLKLLWFPFQITINCKSALCFQNFLKAYCSTLYYVLFLNLLLQEAPLKSLSFLSQLVLYNSKQLKQTSSTPPSPFSSHLKKISFLWTPNFHLSLVLTSWLITLIYTTAQFSVSNAMHSLAFTIALHISKIPGLDFTEECCLNKDPTSIFIEWNV